MGQHSAAATVVALLHILIAALLLRALAALVIDCGKPCGAPAKQVKTERPRNAR